MLKALLARPGVTEVAEIRGRFGVMAYHGGNLERTTDAVARDVAERTGSSFYAVLQAPPLRHHLASTDFDPQQSQTLARFLDHVDVVITIHGYGRRRLWRHLLLGGQNRELALHVAKHLRGGLSNRFRVLDELAAIPKELRGQHPRNPVNRPRRKGVQIELPPTIRWNYREWGWSDHAGVSRTGDVERLVTSLCKAISTWPKSTRARGSQSPVSGSLGSVSSSSSR